MITDSGAREVHDRVEADHTSQVAVVDVTRDRVPADHVTVRRSRRRPDESHDVVAALGQGLDERRADQSRRAGYAEAHARPHSSATRAASWSGLER